MREYILILILFLSLNGYAQNDSTLIIQHTCVPETHPVFIDGGKMGILKALNAGLSVAKCNEIESGKAIVSFIVLEDGTVDSVDVQGAWCEDMRMVLKKTVQEFKFVPGTQAGKPVRVHYKLPIPCIKPE